MTFVVFRILTLCWMTRWLILNKHLVHVGWFSLGCSGLFIMMVINLFLLNRLVKVDFFSKSNTSSSKSFDAHQNVNNDNRNNSNNNNNDTLKTK